MSENLVMNDSTLFFCGNEARLNFIFSYNFRKKEKLLKKNYGKLIVERYIKINYTHRKFFFKIYNPHCEIDLPVLWTCF